MPLPTPYRSARLREGPRPPAFHRARRSPLSCALVVAWLAIDLSPRHVEREADATDPGAPVTHATLLAGGPHLCALTRTRGDTWQVVCRDGARSVNGLDHQLVSRAWESPALVGLVAVHTSEVLSGALGLLADGGAVYFGRESRAVPLRVPSTGAHGPIVAIAQRKGMAYAGFAAQGNWDDYTVVRTRDGAVLGGILDTPGSVYNPGQPLAQLFAPSDDAQLPPFSLDDSLCAATRRGVACVRPSNIATSNEAAAPGLLLEAPDLVAARIVSDQLCTLDRAGALRCARLGNDGRPGAVSPVAGAPPRVEAMDASRSDLCVRAPGARWWCASGPSTDAPWAITAERPLTLKEDPLLRGAAEVALSDAGGCARWPDGGVRCWGRELRGGDYLRRGPTEIRGLRDVRQIAAGSGRTCALARGSVWCWGISHDLRGASSFDARPPRVAIEGSVRAIALDTVSFAAVGASVLLWNDPVGSAVRTLANPPGEDAPIDALAAVGESVCARRVGGHVTCWHYVWNNETESSHYDASRVRALEGYERFAVRDDDVCAWSPSRGGRCWGSDWDAPGIDTRTRIRAARTRDVEALPSRVEGRCAIYSDGDRVCRDADDPASPQPPAPPWAISMTSEIGMSLRFAHGPCAIASGGRVACLDTHRTVMVQTATDSYAHAFWLWIPGLSDARAVVHSFEPDYDALVHACALLGDGRVFCWGENHAGSLTADDADRAPRLLPLRR
ncbi:MAG: RCC1 domain-containing protein [Polyangiales bacterium]